MAPHRWVVSDPNSVPGDPGPRVGRCVRPANLPWRQDLRRRLILAITQARFARTPSPSGKSGLELLLEQMRGQEFDEQSRPANR